MFGGALGLLSAFWIVALLSKVTAVNIPRLDRIDIDGRVLLATFGSLRFGELAALRPLVPVFFSYVLSFIFLGIYWSNHHHLLHAAQHVDGKCLWANLHLLFWLSLIGSVFAVPLAPSGPGIEST